MTAANLFESHHVPDAKVAVQVRTPVRAGGFVPLDGASGEVGEAEFEEVEGFCVVEEERCCFWDLFFFLIS